MEDWLEAGWWGPRREEGVPSSAWPRPGLQDLALLHIPQPPNPPTPGRLLVPFLLVSESHGPKDLGVQVQERHFSDKALGLF